MLAIYVSMLEMEEEKIILEEFYRDNHDFLLNYANRLLNSRERAEDAVHEAFISMINNKDKYFKLSRIEFKKLATVIVRNKCVDIMRHDKNYVDLSDDDMENVLDSKDIPIDSQIIWIDDVERMKNCIGMLDEVSKQIIILKYVEEMSYKEISKMMNLSLHNVKIRIYRAKTKLYELMEGGEIHGI